MLKKLCLKGYAEENKHTTALFRNGAHANETGL